VIRVLLVELEPDDAETRTLARVLRDSGVEVVYAAAQAADEIAAAAVQEDVHAVGLVIRTDEHRRMCAELTEHVGAEIVVFATAESDEHELRRSGVAAIFRHDTADHVTAWAGKLG
jgi:methylmalonyl-CoA mutase C-terminal domain/subunit